MKSVTVKYGIDQVTKQVDDGATFGSVTSDSSIKAVLGFSDNVRVLVNGVEMPSSAYIAPGTVATVETRCNTKAS